MSGTEGEEARSLCPCHGVSGKPSFSFFQPVIQNKTFERVYIVQPLSRYTLNSNIPLFSMKI